MAIIGKSEWDEEGQGEMVFHRKMKFVPDGEVDGEVFVKGEGEGRVTVLTIPLPTAPEMTEAMVATLELVKLTLDLGVGSMGIVSLPPQIAERLWKVYGVDRVKGERWKGMEVWQTEMMPGCLLVEYLGTGHVVHLPHMDFGRLRDEAEEASEVMNLLREVKGEEKNE